MFAKAKPLILCLLFTILPTIAGYVKWITTPSAVKHHITCPIVIECTFYTVKGLIFIFRQEQIQKCIKFFAAPLFYPSGNKSQRTIIGRCVNHCRTVSLVYFLGTIVTLVFLTILPFWTKRFTLITWLPYDPYSNLFTFFFTHSYYALCNAFNIFCLCILDPLLGSLIHHATYQIKKINYKLLNIKQTSHNTYNVVKSCAYEHKLIIRFVRQYEKVFSLIIMCQLAAVIAVAGMLIADLFSDTTETVGSCICILGINLSMFQLLFYCYFGQLLLEENENLKQTIYLSSWYELNHRTKKALLFLMQQSQVPLKIRAGKYIDLTLETFLKMVKATYSLVTILQKEVQ